MGENRGVGLLTKVKKYLQCTINKPKLLVGHKMKKGGTTHMGGMVVTSETCLFSEPSGQK